MKEVRETPKEVYNLRIRLAALVACFAAIIIGYDAGFIGGTVVLPEFLSEFDFDDKSSSEQKRIKANIISLFHAGAFWGSFFIYPVGVYLGRIPGFMMSGFLMIFGSAIQLAANHSRGLGPLYAGRVISGFGIGAVSNLAPMYVSEIAPPAIRGQLIGMYEIAWQVGGLVGYFINYGTEEHLEGNNQWLVPIAVQCIPSGMFFIGVFFIKESPRWYFTRGRKDKALDSLCYLRHLDKDSAYISYEIAAMEEEAAQRKAVVGTGMWGPFKVLLSKAALRYRLLLTSLLFLFQNTTGINAINYYSVSILETMGVNSRSAGLLSTGCFGVIKGISCFIWAFWVVDRFGRKMPVLVMSILSIFSLWYIGAYIKVGDPESNPSDTLDAGAKSALAFFYVWTVGYAFSWSGIPWVYMSEVFDLNVRNAAQCFNAAANWFWAFLLARVTQDMLDAMKYGIFFFFAALLTISNIVYYFLYPETSNIPITDVDLLFEKGVKPWKAHKRALRIIRERQGALLMSDGSVEKQTQCIVEDISKEGRIMTSAKEEESI